VNRVKRFQLGQIVATPGAFAAIEASGDSLLELVERHQAGEWGVVTPGDAAENEFAIIVQLRTMSVYVLKSGVKVWVITEADRSSTCLLLPEEY
jgi:hypothetical protein